MAYEPWETILAARFLETCLAENIIEQGLLIVADPYQVLVKDSSRELRKIRSQSRYRVEFVFRDAKDWLALIKRPDMEACEKTLTMVLDEEGILDRERLFASDVHLNPGEREPYYPKLRREQMERAASLPLARVKSIIDDFSPTAFVMMFDQYLVKNYIGRLAARRGIPIRVFRGARYENYLKCDDFFTARPGHSDAARRLVLDQEWAKKSVPPEFEENLYVTGQLKTGNKEVEEFRTKPLRSSGILIYGYFRSFRKTLRPDYLRRQSDGSRTKYWNATRWRVLIYDLLHVARKLRYIWSPLLLRDEAEIPDRFFLIPLHVRPEDSTLTQGNGLDDEDLIHGAARRLSELDPDAMCLVLEHPAMVGDRRKSFYGRFSGHRNVVFFDPVVSTQELVGRCVGVLTVSGTVALESALRGVPAHVLGIPDYLEAMDSQGVDGLDDFLVRCLSGTATSPQSKASRYLNSIATQGFRANLDWSAIKTEETIEVTVGVLVDMFVAGRRIDEICSIREDLS